MEAVIHRSARVACSPRRAYAYFTQSGLLERFFTVKANVEPRIGGKYELDWDPENTPEQSTVGCKITALAEKRLLAFDWRGPPPHSKVMNDADPLTHVVLAFAPIAGDEDARTDVQLIHTGWRSGEKWQAARDYFDRAWTMVLEALVEEVGAA